MMLFLCKKKKEKIIEIKRKYVNKIICKIEKFLSLTNNDTKQ